VAARIERAGRGMTPPFEARAVTDLDKEARGVLVAAFQSEREEETRD